jgi:hypothetical protein
VVQKLNDGTCSSASSRNASIGYPILKALGL